MAREQFRIEREVLKWARERAGLSIEELAEDFREVASWEIGDRGPTYPQFGAPSR